MEEWNRMLDRFPVIGKRRRRSVKNPAYMRRCTNPQGKHEQSVSEGDTCKTCGAPMEGTT